MNLLYIHTTPLDTNIANLIQVLAMCNAFSSIGIKTTLVLPDSNIKEKTAYRILKENYGIKNSINILFYPVYTNINRINKYLNNIGLRSIINKNKPELIFIRNPIILKTCLRTGIPVIFEFHNSLLHERIKIIDKMLKKQFLKLSKSENLVKIITISDALKDFWVNFGLDNEKIISLHDGFCLEFFEKYKTQSEARKLLGLPMDKKIVVYSGRLIKDRKIENIIKLAENFRDVEFIVMGGPEKESNYFSNYVKIKSLTNIKFIGYVFHNLVSNYLFAADIVLALFSDDVPTINYCSPLKIFEYMASGRIIIAHGYPTIKEILEHDKTAILIKPNNYNDLENKFSIALKLNYPTKLGERSRILAFSNYSWDQRAIKIIKSIGAEKVLKNINFKLN